ncbi:hypothetical protein ACFFX0_29725 [Citricoccus parietis]|uniref:Glyoxalase-like domain-containing protein n=1 Tax=Citricoccus parietis TaxID=592307 RepID=A0ABV5G841_9MICC
MAAGGLVLSIANLNHLVQRWDAADYSLLGPCSAPCSSPALIARPVEPCGRGRGDWAHEPHEQPERSEPVCDAAGHRLHVQRLRDRERRGERGAHGHTRGSAASRMFRGNRQFEIQDLDGTPLFRVEDP